MDTRKIFSAQRPSDRRPWNINHISVDNLLCALVWGGICGTRTKMLLVARVLMRARTCHDAYGFWIVRNIVYCFFVDSIIAKHDVQTQRLET